MGGERLQNVCMEERVGRCERRALKRSNAFDHLLFSEFVLTLGRGGCM